MSDPVVLVPGMLCDARVFAPQIAALSVSRSVQVVPATRGDTIEEIAEAALSDAPDRFALAGLSLGGVVAMEIQRQRPDRVLRLALIGTSPLPDTPEAAAAREPQIAAARAGRLDDVVREVVKPDCLAPGPQRVAVLNLVMEMARALGPDVFVRQSRAMQRRRDRQAALRAVSVPTLILCGRHDALCPQRRHEFMRDLVPGAVMEVIDEAGHFPTLEAPQAANAAIARWLSGTLLLK